MDFANMSALIMFFPALGRIQRGREGGGGVRPDPTTQGGSRPLKEACREYAFITE